MKVTARCLYPILLCLIRTAAVHAQCGTCTYTETALEGSSPLVTIPAGTTVCITTNTCLGAASSYPSTCANPGPGSLTLDGTLRICDGVTLLYAGTITGTGTIEIMNGGRLSIYGTYDCDVQITAVDPSLLSGTDLSSQITSPCASTSCQPTFPDGYSPFGIIPNLPGYNVAHGPCTVTGGTENYVLPVQLTSWTAVWQDGSVLLSWSASNDDQHYQYGIDYSKDGQTWVTLPKTIPGGANNYSYLDPGPFAAHNFFRLHWQDAAGRDTYSSIKELDAGQPGPDALSISPNPVQSILTVHTILTTSYSLQVVDITGTPRLQLLGSTGGNYNLGSLSPGTYFLVIGWADGTRTVKKLTKL